MDYKIFKAINGLAGKSKFCDTFMVVISKKARYIYLFFLIIMWFRSKTFKKVTVLAVLSFAVTYIVTFLIKQTHYKPRPFIDHQVNLIPPKPPLTNSSYISKHTSLAFAVSLSVLLFNWLWGIVLSFLSILVGISRIWMGHHYPSEVWRSALLGSYMAYRTFSLKRLWKPIIKQII